PPRHRALEGRNAAATQASCCVVTEAGCGALPGRKDSNRRMPWVRAFGVHPGLYYVSPPRGGD
ncbi:MAG: hypothetical protein IJT83_13790, partial [Victivallales bacterium]|nr:hypothetical protein [Victivallales bacterium]